MSARVVAPGVGRVLVVGGPDSAQQAVAALEAAGYLTASVAGAQGLAAAAAEAKADAVLFTAGTVPANDALAAMRREPALRDLPFIGDLTGAANGSAAALTQARLDDWVHFADELAFRVESSIRARRMIAREEQARLRMEILLEITQAATSSLELEEIMRIAVDKICRGITADRCSVVLVEGQGPRSARVVATRENSNITSLQLDLVKYPELRRALETRQTIYVEDAHIDPLMDEVRPDIAPLGVKSILVQPLICQDDLLGALFLRLSRSEGEFGREDQEFLKAISGALANSIRNSRLHAALRRKRDDLESAYVDRYRELNEANRRLKEINRTKDEIIAVVSHDLRAPLQVLLGHARLLLGSKLDAEQQLSSEAILRQGRKILDLVESLLERGRGEQARVSLDPVQLDVAELCKETANDLSIIARDKGVTLRAETPESLYVLGDEVKLREILQNLISNAIQHAKSRVVVRAQRLRRPDGEAARVLVQDDGPGLPPSQVHLVFDRYRHGPGGIGLGLAIVKEFIELHGGEVWAESPPDGGTWFIFTVPLVHMVVQRKNEALVKAPPSPTEAAEHIRVLVVEDEPQIAAVLEEILRSRYRVEVARDGAEGLAKARALHPDLVVMDVFLPKLDGLDAAVALKSTPDTADIPVILISAHQGVAEKVRALNLGAIDYMHKPFQALELLTRTERALSLRNAEREVERSHNLLRRAGSDPETGLFDRVGLIARLEQERSRAKRYGRPLSLAVMQPGTAPMKDVIRGGATMVRARLRAPDVVGHLGSGVLGVALPECAPEGARTVLGRLLPELQELTAVRYRIQVVDLMSMDRPAEQVIDTLLAEPAPGQSASGREEG
ncbi:MAG TPA: ATP-binding protein [Myxococcaceae bacterium]|nr:ATP-binding protein [Myxococcaceae bacterium]